jgi:hypothetical protein
MAPVFGVVQTYAVYRSSDGATPILIGSVSGVNGFAPATTFTDTNPDLTSQTVVYTISTSLAPVPIDPTSRQSPPSPPAVLTNDQTIALGSLPSSVTISGTPVTVTATALTSGAPNGQQVSFSAVGSPSGSCSIGNQSIASGVSSASVVLNSAGSCTITASQPGSSASQLQTDTPPYFNAASVVSGTFMILAQSSSTQSQTIAFPALPNVQYGGTFTLSPLSSSVGLPVTFTASGPCTTSGGTTGVGVCMITAMQSGNSTYSAASVTQSFTIFPAVLQVAATNLAVAYGQSLPTLTYTYSGFVNSDLPSVVSGAAALSTTATTGSNAGSYPITVSTGTLAAANYSFLYVTGTLTIQPGSQSALLLTAPSQLTYNQSAALSVTGGSSGGALTYNLTGPCSVSGGQLTANSGTGSCTVTATMAGNSNYSSVTSTPVNTVTLSLASQAITFTTNPPASAGYNSSFTVAATGGASGKAVSFTSSGSCSNTGATYKMTSGTGSCSVIANQAGNTNYAAAPQITVTVNPTLATPTVTFTGAPTGAAYNSHFTVASTTNASTTAVISSSGACSNSGTAVTMTSGTGTCLLTATWAADTHYSGATATQSTAAALVAQAITFTTNPPASAAYNSSFTVAATGGASGNAVTFTSSGSCSNTGATYKMTSSTGTCSVIANQAGNTNYAAAPPITKAVNATGPLVSISPSTINFGTVYLGSITTNTITVTNIGTAPVTVNAPLLSIVKGGNSNEFVAVNLCLNSLAVGKSCTITIAFVAGPFYTAQTATLQIMDNAPGSPQPVALSASVINPLDKFSATSLSFGTVKHATSSSLNVTLSNPGATPLNFSGTGISVTGANATTFVQTNNCGSSLAAGATCTVAVKFTPPTTGTFSANLSVVDNAQAGGGTQTIPLSGKGN